MYLEQQRNYITFLVSVAGDINNKIYLQKRSRKKKVKRKAIKKLRDKIKVTIVIKGGDNLLDHLFCVSLIN